MKKTRKERNALYEKPYTEWTAEDIVEELAERYTPPEVPPCRLCGGELSVQSIGNGPTIYACVKALPSGATDYDHYADSRWEDYRCGGDSLVMELIRRYTAGQENSKP